MLGQIETPGLACSHASWMQVPLCFATNPLPKERQVGQATELVKNLRVRSLSRADIEKREAAMETGGQVEVGLDGKLYKPETQTEPRKEVMTLPQQTWD